MKIALDLTPIGIKTNDKGGIYHYIINLVLALQEIDTENEYTLFFNFFNSENLEAFQQISKLLKKEPNYKIKLSRFPRRLWLNAGLPVEFFTGFHDLYHSFYDFIPSSMRCKLVVTIHDLRYLESENDLENWKNMLLEVPDGQQYLADYSQREKRLDFLRSKISQTAQRSHRIITTSQFSKKQILEHLNVPEEKVKVVYQGVPLHFYPAKTDNENPPLKELYGQKYILYVSKFDPLKNHIRLLRSFYNLKRDFNIKEKLVLAGPVNWCFHVLNNLVEEMNLENDVLFTSYLSDLQLADLYRHASVFVFPSLFEGFGRPVVEAMACGIPVICSNLSSLPEIAGKAALFINPFSQEEIAAAIYRVLTDNDLAASLVEKGLKRAKKFSLKKAACQMLTIYNQTL